MGKEFTGFANAMRQSPWLSCEDISAAGGRATVVIERTNEHEDIKMEEGRVLPKCYSVKFVGKDRELILNATNRRALVSAFGLRVKDWVGKTIILYVQDGVRSPKGGKTSGIRISIPE